MRQSHLKKMACVAYSSKGQNTHYGRGDGKVVCQVGSSSFKCRDKCKCFFLKQQSRLNKMAWVAYSPFGQNLVAGEEDGKVGFSE